jgi:hypothetical protein
LRQRRLARMLAHARQVAGQVSAPATPTGSRRSHRLRRSSTPNCYP